MENLEKCGFKPLYFETAKEAADYICSSVRGTTVGMGGSVTSEQLGIYERLSENNEVFWHWKQETLPARNNAAAAAVYITSANAISENGEIVNIDATGNRVASMCYGHEKLIIVAGTNKVCPDLESAIYRAKNVASPLNAIRLGRKTPCALSDVHKCYNCSSPDRMCSATVILSWKVKGIKEIEVIIVGEELGY